MRLALFDAQKKSYDTVWYLLSLSLLSLPFWRVLTGETFSRNAEKKFQQRQVFARCVLTGGQLFHERTIFFPVLLLYITFILQNFFFLSGVEWVKQNRLFFTHTTPVYDSWSCWIFFHVRGKIGKKNRPILESGWICSASCEKLILSAHVWERKGGRGRERRYQTWRESRALEKLRGNPFWRSTSQTVCLIQSFRGNRGHSVPTARLLRTHNATSQFPPSKKGISMNLLRQTKSTSHTYYPDPFFYKFAMYSFSI
jgi:hypothetical protein